MQKQKLNIEIQKKQTAHKNTVRAQKDYRTFYRA